MYREEYLYESLEKLEHYINKCQYRGFDPYDVLNSEVLNKIKNKFIRIILTQLFVYSPLDFRNFFRTSSGINPKAIGLILRAYCKMQNTHVLKRKNFSSLSNELVDILLDNSSKGYSGYCWGFNFDWQDVYSNTKKGMPTIVVTSFVASAFLDLYEITKNKKFLEIAESSCHFILNDLYKIKIKGGFCFSYTPINKYVVHDANLLGISLLSRVYSITKDKMLIEQANQAVDGSLSYQKNNGCWIYGINPFNGKLRNQIDYHQGFIIDSLCDYINYTNEKKGKYLSALKKATNFYMNKQFDKNGRSKWRIPFSYPVDIHHQAQGIITFSKLYKNFKDYKYLDFAEKIALWTINNMQDKTGYFYYQKWPIIMNKIPYIRWGQAWMILALATLIKTLEDEYKLVDKIV